MQNSILKGYKMSTLLVLCSFLCNTNHNFSSICIRVFGTGVWLWFQGLKWKGSFWVCFFLCLLKMFALSLIKNCPTQSFLHWILLHFLIDKNTSQPWLNKSCQIGAFLLQLCSHKYAIDGAQRDISITQWDPKGYSFWNQNAVSNVCHRVSFFLLSS